MKFEACLALLGFSAAVAARVRGPPPGARGGDGSARALAASAPAKVAAPSGNASASSGSVTQPTPVKPRVHLDLGFADFEKNLTAQVASQVRNASAFVHWTPAQSEALVANITHALNSSMKVALQPLKLSIGKTWLALPREEQKDTYVAQLKSAFLPVFAASVRTTENHLRLSLHRIDDLERPLGEGEVVSCSKVLIDGLLAEHCYDAAVSSKNSAVGKPAMMEVPAHNATTTRRFCIQSVVDGLAHRLNDTQGLLSMSMRFEAGAMSLAQRAKLGNKR